MIRPDNHYPVRPLNVRAETILFEVYRGFISLYRKHQSADAKMNLAQESKAGARTRQVPSILSLWYNALWKRRDSNGA